MIYDLELKVNEVYQIPSDIDEHIPTLIKYASECNHITEMGVRGICSTWGLLGGIPEKMISYDLQDPKIFGGDIESVKETANAYNIDYQFVLADVLKIEIEETDLLFLDTWHAYKQLKAELNLHSSKVKKFIIMHDTTSYATKDESLSSRVTETEDGECYNCVKDNKGLQLAIDEFLSENKGWELCERFINNNGLTILKRVHEN